MASLKNFRTLLFSFIAGSLLAACERGNDPAKAVVETVRNVAEGGGGLVGADMRGEWTSECHDSDLLDLSERVTYLFTGNEFEKRYRFYNDENCNDSSRAVELSYYGTYEVVDAKANNEPDAKGLNLEYTRVVALASNQAGQEVLNAANFCGKSDWPVGEEQEITRSSGETKCPVREVPATVHEVYVIQDDRLYFGKTDWFSDQESAGERPQEINKEEAFTSK